MAYNGGGDSEGDMLMEDYADPYNKAKYESDSSARDHPYRSNNSSTLHHQSQQQPHHHHQSRLSQSSFGAHEESSAARRYSPYSPMQGMSPASAYSPYGGATPAGHPSPSARQALHSSHSQQAFSSAG